MNTKKNNTVAPLLTVRTVNALERVHGDLMDAGDGKTWCSIVDNFSKVAVTAVIPSKTPENVIKTFKLFIAKYGKPKEIQWDNGSEQRGVFPAWCEKKAIKLVNSSVGHPQSNGKVERYQQSIMSMAIAVKQVKGGTVSDHLDEVVVAYNNRPHSSLGKFTPAYVFSTCLSDATEQILNLRLQISKHQQQVHSRDAKRRAKAKNCEKIAARDHVFIFAGDKHHNKGEPRYKYKAEIVERYDNHTCKVKWLETGGPLKRDKPSVIASTKYRVSCMKMCKKYKESDDGTSEVVEEDSLVSTPDGGQNIMVDTHEPPNTSEVIYDSVPVISRKNRTTKRRRRSDIETNKRQRVE